VATGAVSGTGTGAGFRRASLVAVLATTGGLLAVFVTSALAPQLERDVHVTEATLGAAVAVFFATGSVAAPFCGPLADRVGSVRMMRAALVLAALVLTGVAVAVHGATGLVVALAIGGLSNGAIQPSANRYVSRLAPLDRQGLAFGIKQAAIPAAILLSGLAVPAAVYVTDWRSIYLGAAVVTAAVAVTIRRPAQGRRAAAVRATVAHEPLPVGRLVVLAAGWGLASAGANALGAFFVLSAVHVGFSQVVAGLLAAAGSVVSIAVRIGAGSLADRSAGNGLGLVAGMCAVGSVGVGLLAGGSPWVYAAAPVLGYGLGWGWAGLLNYAVVRTHASRPGRASGLAQAGASAGACSGPLLFGVVATHTGYAAAWLTAGALLLLAVGFVLVGRRMLPAPAAGA